MKPDNIILLAVASIMAFLVWCAFGPSSSPSAHVSSVDLRSAVASGQPVLTDFYADWCGPCRSMKPAVHELADDLRGKLQVVQINVDEQHALAQEYKVHSIPCFVLLKDGKEAARQTGSMPKVNLRQMTGL